MVKSGEVYTNPKKRMEGMFIHDVSERPRMIMNPASCGPGIMTCLSSIFYEPLRRLMPGFI